MAIKFSQFNLRTDHTSGMYLVGYDGNQNIHITVDNLFDDFINGTENTIAMFGTDGTVLVDSILSQDAGATLLTVAGQLNVDAAATFDTSLTVTGDSTLNGNITLGDASTDLITQTGTLYLNGPVKDTTDTLGAVDQVLLSDATGELTFTDLADLHVGGAEVVEVPVKNVQGFDLIKGDPVYISGSVGASGRLEVQLADASNALKMPAVGLLKQNLADNAEGFAVVTGKLRNLITDPIDSVNPTENDVIYVKPSGTPGNALTTTKPVYGNFIQNIGKVGRVSTAADGNLVVSSILRTNDIPNLTPGRLWIGSTGNTIESQTLFVDEASSEVGIGTNDPYAELHIKNTVDNPGLMIESEEATGGIYQNSYINLRARESSTNTLATAVISIHGVNSTNSAGAKTLRIRNQTLGGADVLISTLDSSNANKDAARFKSSGQVQFEEYGSGSFTGTIAKNLSIDSSGNIIETDPAVDGSGTLNYVPKWTPDGNTLGDSIIYDNGTQVGIGTESVSTFKLTVAGAVKIDGSNLNITNVIPAIYLNSSNSNPDWSLNNQGGEFSIRNNTLSQKRLTISSAGQVGFTLYGQNTFTGTAAKNLSVTSSGAIIETEAVPANIVETVTTTDGTYINLTPNSPTDGAVTVTADLSAVDGTSDTATRFLSKDNTWDVPSYTTVTTTDGTYINLTPNSATSGAVTVTADLSAVDGTAGTNERYLTKNNTWAEISTIPGTYDWSISDGTNSETIGSGDTVIFAGGTNVTTSYNAANNTLTINSTDQYTGTVTSVSGGTYITSGGTATDPILNHDATSRTDTTSTGAPGYGGTFTVVDSVSTNATGHLEAINVKTVTMPSADDTNTTYDLSGYGANNGASGIQLVGSDGTTDQVAITGAGTTLVTRSGNTITVTSNDQYTGTVTGSGVASVTGGQIPYWDATTNITGTTELNYSTVSGGSVGRVGIGNSNTNAFSNSRLVVGNGSGGANMTLYGGGSNTNGIAFANGTSGNAQYRGQVRYNLQTNNLEFLTNGETFSRVYVDSAFDLNLVERGLNFRNSWPYDVGAYIDIPSNDQLSIGTNGSERIRINSSGNVGIGTTNPTAGVELSIQGSSPQIDFINSSSTDVHASIEAESDTGTGGKLIFKTKRNGNTPTNKLVIREDGAIQQGNSSATGQFAAAFGQNNTASSLDAFATGENTTASGRQAFSGGFDTTASGNSSFAVGGGTTASGENAFAANGTTVASGISSAAFGAFSEATATNAFAINGDNTASGESSFALGVSSSAQALGSIASGLNCSTGAGANGAFAGGVVSNANNQFSIAYGDVANASGRVSQALGYIVNATAQYSFAQGFNNTVNGTASAVFGQQNLSTGTASWSLSTGFLNTTRDSASLTVGSFNGMTASIVSREQFMLGRYLNVPRDSSGNPSAGCLVVGEHNAYLNRPNVKFAVGTGVGVGAEADSFTVLKDGNVLMEQVVNKNYSSDSAAAAGGVPVGGIYHNSGDLKIRLT